MAEQSFGGFMGKENSALSQSKIAIVTGPSRGLGRNTGIDLAKRQPLPAFPSSALEMLGRVQHSKTGGSDSASKEERQNSREYIHAHHKQGIQQFLGERYSEGQGILWQDAGA
jgi:hypothetical protein